MVIWMLLLSCTCSIFIVQICACKYMCLSGLRAQQHRSQQFTTVLWYVSRCAPQYTAQPSFPAHWATRPSWDEKEQDTPDTPGGSTDGHFPIRYFPFPSLCMLLVNQEVNDFTYFLFIWLICIPWSSCDPLDLLLGTDFS